MDSAIADLKNVGFRAVFKHIPAHVGIYGNEKADRLAKAAMERAHKATPHTAEEAQDRILEGYANDIVFACLQHTAVRRLIYMLYIGSCVVTNKTKSHQSSISLSGGLIILHSVSQVRDPVFLTVHGTENAVNLLSKTPLHFAETIRDQSIRGQSIL